MHNQNPKSNYSPCYTTHKSLAIGDHLIYGGSCSSPMIQDADIYVGFDFSIAKSEKSYPWNEGESFLFHIQDQHAPKDVEEFKKLIDWLAVQLAAQKKIHLGCIGGHGRTGTALAALVAQVTGNKDAIQYVRENYCEKAVESQAQIDFLAKHYGCSIVAPRSYKISSQVHKFQSKYPKASAFEIAPRPEIFAPVNGTYSLWGSNATIEQVKNHGIMAV
jgi:hypothetical protein